MRTGTSHRFFKHDAFITYAHGDNEKGVVDALHAQLLEFLFLSLEWEPSIWLDARMLESEAGFEEQIREGLRDSAVLIIVNSEKIDTRQWCRDEMSWFLNGAQFEHVNVQRTYPVFVPFNSVEELPQRVKHELQRMKQESMDIFVLDPMRHELMAQQDYRLHGEYWDQLYRLFAQVSNGIVAVHAIWEEAIRQLSAKGDV